jgi:hypothetical protein
MGEEESGNSESLKARSSIIYIVDFSEEFNYFYSKVWSSYKLDLIDDFIDHYEDIGLKGWKGRIVKSTNVPEHYPDAKERIALASKYNLYHAHIGLPTWNTRPNFPYSTSDQVLHFQKVSYNEIKLLTVSTHNPMDLPTEENILG